MVEAPFEVRRLIRDLPELLAGPEPVLQTDRAKEFIRQDPVARGLITAAVEMSAAMQAGTRAIHMRIKEPPPPHLRRPIEVAAKHFRERLAWIAFDRGLDAFEEDAAATQTVLASVEYGRSGFNPRPFKPTLAECRQMLGNEGELIEQVLGMSDEPKPTAAQLMAHADAISPGMDGIRYYTTFYGMTQSDDPIKGWLIYAASCQSSNCIGAALQRAAVISESIGDLTKAIHLSNQAVAANPLSGFAIHYAALMAALGASEADFMKAMARWSDAVSSGILRAETLVRIADAHWTQWIQADLNRHDMVTRGWSLFPTWFAKRYWNQTV